MILSLLIIFSIFLIILSKVLKNKAEKIRKKNKIQSGKITYSDIHRIEHALFSKKYMIAGKPDYVVERKGCRIPVELKTGCSSRPKSNHIYQLAAYCHLLEENYGAFVPYGILVYNNSCEYKIPFDPKIRFELENTIKKMRYSIRTGNITLNHDDPQRCIVCSMKNHCDKK
jgi:CRISPR-associated exonuclease Cas4